MSATVLLIARTLTSLFFLFAFHDWKNEDKYMEIAKDDFDIKLQEVLLKANSSKDKR